MRHKKINLLIAAPRSKALATKYEVTTIFVSTIDDERQHMEEQAVQQGGKICVVGDSSCTHLIVDEHTVKSLPFEPQGRIYIVVPEVKIIQEACTSFSGR